MLRQTIVTRTGAMLLFLLALGLSCRQAQGCAAHQPAAAVCAAGAQTPDSPDSGQQNPAVSGSALQHTASAGSAQPAEQASGDEASVSILYQEYVRRLNEVTDADDIAANGFQIVADQIFPFTLTVPAEPAAAEDGPDGSFGSFSDSGTGSSGSSDSSAVSDIPAPSDADAPGSSSADSAPSGDALSAASLIPAFDRESRRLVLFFADGSGAIFYRTDQLETNYQTVGQLAQPNEGISAITFQDLNGDSLTDIVIITSCVSGTGTRFRIGDVLFQNAQQTGFYRDYRISDKINRFGMNKSTNEIAAFVRDGHSAEFMYTAATLSELQSHGMQIIEEQCYTRTFEKPGRLQVVPGTCRIANYDVFLIYLADEQGCIVSSLQPMGDADNLYALKGIQCRDIDGDGLKDIVVLARYSYEENDGQFTVKSDYSVYYQRTGGFSADTAIKDSCPCSDEDTMEQLVTRLRAYWGWKSEQ